MCSLFLICFVRGSTVSMYTCIQMNKKVQYQVTSALTCNTGNIHTDMPANTLHCQVTVTLTCHNDNTQRCANRHTLSIFREHSHWHVTLLTSAMTCQLTEYPLSNNINNDHTIPYQITILISIFVHTCMHHFANNSTGIACW